MKKIEVKNPVVARLLLLLRLYVVLLVILGVIVYVI